MILVKVEKSREQAPQVNTAYDVTKGSLVWLSCDVFTVVTTGVGTCKHCEQSKFCECCLPRTDGGVDGVVFSSAMLTLETICCLLTSDPDSSFFYTTSYKVVHVEVGTHHIEIWLDDLSTFFHNAKSSKHLVETVHWIFNLFFFLDSSWC